MAALFLGTEHPSNQNEGDDSRGDEDESQEDRNIREANAGRWGGGCEVIRHVLTSCLCSHMMCQAHFKSIINTEIYCTYVARTTHTAHTAVLQLPLSGLTKWVVVKI